MAGHFTVFKDRAGKFRFNLKASNGEIIAASESYPDKKSVLKGIASVVKNAAVAKIVDTTVEKDVPKKAAGKAAAGTKAPKAKAVGAKAPKTKVPKAKAAGIKVSKATVRKTTADGKAKA